MAFDYFTPGEAEQYAFYRVPKLLITGEQFRTLSMEAKLLYGILLDRVSLSLRHGWVDEQNHVYIIYTIEQIMNERISSNYYPARSEMKECVTAERNVRTFLEIGEEPERKQKEVQRKIVHPEH